VGIGIEVEGLTKSFGSQRAHDTRNMWGLPQLGRWKWHESAHGTNGHFDIPPSGDHGWSTWGPSFMRCRAI
jgi:hypothetical protein